MLSQNDIKKLVGEEAASLVQPGMTVGIGTGSTVYWFIEALGKRVQEGLTITGVVTSIESGIQAAKLGIELADFNTVKKIDLTIDGADEIGPQLHLIKGGGGALLQEKMIAAASKELVIIADHSKHVKKLGAFPLPVEVIPFGWKQTARHIEKKCRVKTTLREKDSTIYTTDHGHYILDCHFQEIPDPVVVNTTLHLIPGVVETGLFVNMASKALIGNTYGQLMEIKKVSV